MIRLTLRFYGDLNELVYNSHKGKEFVRRIPAPTSVKDLIEGCGVPHTEVDLILADGKRVDFSYLISANQYISVYPVFYFLDAPASDYLQPETPPDPRFVVDVNLGKLAGYLRMAGFDATYRNDAEDEELIQQMEAEQRILLTRDRKLLMRNAVRYGYLPRSDDPSEQLAEVIRRFDLFDSIEPFSRCPNCNSPLQPVAKEEVLDQLEPLTKRYYDTFSQCPNCGQVYWAGSHIERMNPTLKRFFNNESLRHTAEP